MVALSITWSPEIPDYSKATAVGEGIAPEYYWESALTINDEAVEEMSERLMNYL